MAGCVHIRMCGTVMWRERVNTEGAPSGISVHFILAKCVSSFSLSSFFKAILMLCII